jgi:hypothetical protein
MARLGEISNARQSPARVIGSGCFMFSRETVIRVNPNLFIGGSELKHESIGANRQLNL